MQFAALFVEYFVSGTCAMLWLMPALGIRLEKLAGLQQGAAVLLLPFVYLLGHAIDVGSYALVKPVRLRIKNDTADPELVTSGAETAFIMYKSADVGRLLLSLSSRDRIARGAVFNALFVGIALVARPEMFGLDPRGRVLAGLASLVAALIMFIVWWRFEGLTRRFRHEAIRAIQRYPNAK